MSENEINMLVGWIAVGIHTEKYFKFQFENCFLTCDSHFCFLRKNPTMKIIEIHFLEVLKHRVGNTCFTYPDL